MDTSPIVKDNRTYLPAKYLAEAFGFNVSWDAATQAVNILAKNSIVGSYISDVVSSFEDSCAIALYETDYTALNREFIDIESAKIVFRDGRSIDVTESFVDATDELKAVFTEMGWDIDVAYAGKIQYDFSPEENQLFQLQVKAKIADTEGNIGHQYYTRIIDISDGQGGYL